MFIRALRGKAKTWRAEHISTLDTVNDLGVLYQKQGRIAEAKGTYMLALRGYQKALGENHPDTRRVSQNLKTLQARKLNEMNEEGEVDIAES